MARAHLIMGALVLGMAGTACESVEPGDYVVYRVASTSEALSEGCYWQYQGADANVRNDQSTLQSSSTFILYAGVDTARYLSAGELTLDGELVGDVEGGEGYEFEGKSVDIEWSDGTGSGSGAKRTVTVKTEVEMTVDGALVFGEVEIKTSYSCNGQGCGEQPPSCTQTIEFVGTEVEDVTLHHDVPGGSAGPDSPPSDDDDGSGPGVGAGGSGGQGGAGGEGGAGGGGGGECVDTNGSTTAVEGDCYAACEILFCCAAEECAGVSEADQEAFFYGVEGDGCLASCEIQPALVSVINGGDCVNTVGTISSVDNNFANTCQNGVGGQ